MSLHTWDLACDPIGYLVEVVPTLDVDKKG